MQNIGQWVLVVVGIVFIAELIAGRHRGLYDRGEWLVNGVTMFIGAAVRPLGAVAVATLIGFAFPAGKGALADVPFVPALIAIILLAELANYWVHRLSHELKGSRRFDWLWRMHRTHHSAKYVNVLLHFRVSLFWALVAGLTWVLSLAVYLGQAKAAGAAVIVFSLWGILTHSNFRWDDAIRRHPVVGRAFRALEHVLVSPGVHHSHHGYGKDGGNYRNFGIFLAIYDWMFGTLHIPQGRPFRYGLPGSSPHWADDAFSPINVGTMLGKLRTPRILQSTP